MNPRRFIASNVNNRFEENAKGIYVSWIQS